MRIVDVGPVLGNNGRSRAHRPSGRFGWIAILSCWFAGCSMTPEKVPLRDPPLALTAEDLALIERIQAEYAVQSGDFQVAADRLAKAAMLSDDPNQSLSALRAALYLGRRDAARVLYARWRKLAPDAPALPAYAVALALASGDHAEAQAAVASGGSGAIARRRLAEALRWVQPVERVLPFIEDLVTASNEIEDWIHWTWFVRERRAPEVALRLADLTVERFPDDARGFGLRAALLRESRPAAAVADLEQALRLDPGSTDIRLSLAQVYDAIGQPLRSAEVVSEISPATDATVAAELHYAIRANDRKAMTGAYQRLKALPEPRPPERLVLLAQVAERIGLSAEAEQWYAAVPKGNRYGTARLGLARLQIDRGAFAEAEQTIRDLRATGLLVRDELVRSFLLEGEVRAKIAGAEAALAVYQAGLRMLPDDGDLMYAHALTLASLGRYEQMERELRRMIELYPNDADALNALGYSLVDQNRNLDEAAALLARAEQLDPEDPALLDSLGWLAYRRGDLETALAKLRASYERLADPEVAAHLGEVLWQKGEREEAARIWAQALERAPGHRVIVETMQRLQQP